MTASEFILEAVNAAYTIRSGRLNEKIAMFDEIARNAPDAKTRRVNAKWVKDYQAKLADLTYTLNQALAELEIAGLYLPNPVELMTIYTR